MCKELFLYMHCIIIHSYNINILYLSVVRLKFLAGALAQMLRAPFDYGRLELHVHHGTHGNERERFQLRSWTESRRRNTRAKSRSATTSGFLE